MNRGIFATLGLLTTVLAAQPASAVTLTTNFMVRGSSGEVHCIATNVGDKALLVTGTLVESDGNPVIGGTATIEPDHSALLAQSNAANGFCKFEFSGRSTALRAHACKRANGASTCTETFEAH